MIKWRIDNECVNMVIDLADFQKVNKETLFVLPCAAPKHDSDRSAQCDQNNNQRK